MNDTQKSPRRPKATGALMLLLASLALTGCQADDNGPSDAPQARLAAYVVPEATTGPPPVLAASAAPTGDVSVGPLIGGLATWYDDGPGYYAAAGPDLRKALGENWRGMSVSVSVKGREPTLVVLSDWCACGRRNGSPTLIDLSPQAFIDLTGDLSIGVVRVSVEPVGLRLPATDTPDQHPEDPPEHPDDERMRQEDFCRG
jgi:hypothetical protein